MIKERNKLDYISALRGIAIILVMMVHTSSYDGNQNVILSSFFKFGAKGVQLFFLASAFTLFLSYNYRSKQESNFKINFYIRRFFRIAPMYYLGITYYQWQQQNFAISNSVSDVWNIIANIFFVHGLSPYWINNLVPGGWSITVEIFFYALVPFLFTRIKNLDGAVKFTLVTFFLSMSFRVFLAKFVMIENTILWGEFSYYNFITQLPAFGMGIIAYFLIIKKDFYITPVNSLLVFVVIMAHFIWGRIIPNFLLIGGGFLFLLYILSRKEYKIFVNRVTLFFGKISYSAYLVHFAVLFWINKIKLIKFLNSNSFKDIFLINYALRFLILIFCTSIIAFFFYNVIEVPFQRLGKKIITDRNKLKKSKPIKSEV